MATLKTRHTLLMRVRDPTDGGAWEEFVRLYTPIIFGFLRRRGVSNHDAEDLTQDVFRALARAMPSFEFNESIGTFRNWLFTVTRNKLNTHFGRARRLPSYQSSVPEQAQTKDWDELYMKELFKVACLQVEPQVESSTWQAFWRTAVSQESVEVVAQDLGLEVGNIYTKRSRVLRRIRAALLEADQTVFFPKQA